MSMGVGAYFYARSLKAGEVYGTQHIGWWKYAFLSSPGERACRYVKRARQLPFGEGGNRVVGEVSETIIRSDQNWSCGKLGLPLQAVSELRHGDGLPSAGYYYVKVGAERGGANGEGGDPIRRIRRDRMIQEDGNRAHHDLPTSLVSSISAAHEPGSRLRYRPSKAPTEPDELLGLLAS